MAKVAKKVKGKQKQVVTVNGLIVTVEYPTIGKSVSLDISRVNDEVETFLKVHGAKQILGDSASGRPAEEKYEMASRRVEAFYEGETRLTAQPDTLSIVAEAVARIKEVDVQVVLKGAEMQPEVVAKWRKDARVQQMVHQIYSERAAERIEEEGEDELVIPGLDEQ